MSKRLPWAALAAVALGALWAYMVSDEKRFATLSKAIDLLADRIQPA
jgi:hypothetical protein